jgi:hypothetical protein
MQIVGFDLREARPVDLAIGVALFGLYVQVAVW